MTRLIVAAVVSLGILGFSSKVVAAEGDATEKLLKDGGFSYTKLKGGVFKVVLESKSGTTSLLVAEQKSGWQDNNKNDVLNLYILAPVLTTPTDFKPPTAMLTKIMEVNNRIKFGTLSLLKNPDGSQTLYRGSSVFLKNLDVEQLADLVVIAHFDQIQFQKDFKGFLEGE